MDDLKRWHEIHQQKQRPAPSVCESNGCAATCPPSVSVECSPYATSQTLDNPGYVEFLRQEYGPQPPREKPWWQRIFG